MVPGFCGPPPSLLTTAAAAHFSDGDKEDEQSEHRQPFATARGNAEKLYHTSLKTAPRSFLIELQILHLNMLRYRLMHDAAYKNNQLSLI
jgi:hypothetical protein